LIVCFGTSMSHQRLLVGNNSLPNPSSTNPPTPLAPQLVVFTAGSSFLSTGTIVNSISTATPVTATVNYATANNNNQPGVQCNTLYARNNVVLVQVPGGPFYANSQIGSTGAANSWVQITRDPNASPSVGGPLVFGIPTVTDSIFLQPGGSSVANNGVYFYGQNFGPITSPSPSDFINTIWRYSGSGNNWIPIISTTLTQNVTINQFVVGNGGDSQIYFCLNPNTFGFSLPSFLDDVHLPIENYVYLSSGNSFNYLAPTAQIYPGPSNNFKLWYETNGGGYLVVYGPGVTGVVIGNRQTNRVPNDDHAYYSKAFNGMIRTDSSSTAAAGWANAYAGGFDVPPSTIYSTPSGLTFFGGAFNWAFQRFTGPISQFDSTLGVWTWANGARHAIDTAAVDIDGGDFKGCYGGYAVVYDVQQVSLFGQTGLLVAGIYRTADQGDTICNSICFFPAGTGDKLNLPSSPLSSFYPSYGVRNSNPSGAPSIIPEHASFAPGTIYSFVVVAGTVYAGGSFNIAGDAGAQNFATWSQATGWKNAFGGVNGPVFATVEYAGNVIIGGTFTNVGFNFAAQNVAGWNVKTGQWFTLNRGLDGTVYRLMNFRGKLLALGAFATGSGQTLHGTAVWDGTKWTPLEVNNLHDSACQIYYCFATEVDGTSAVLDAWDNGAVLYLLTSSSATSVELVAYYGKDSGFARVDGQAWESGAPAFTNTLAPTSIGIKFLATGTDADQIDLWNVQQATQVDFVQSYQVSVWNTKLSNFENKGNKGTNGFVFAALPGSPASVLCISYALIALLAFLLL
jgi:hypothetical protein